MYIPDKKTKTSIDKKYGNVLPVSGLSLLTQMLKFDPSKRISASAALSHQYFQEQIVSVPAPSKCDNLTAAHFCDSEIPKWIRDWAGGI